MSIISTFIFFQKKKKETASKKEPFCVFTQSKLRDRQAISKIKGLPYRFVFIRLSLISLIINSSLFNISKMVEKMKTDQEKSLSYRIDC